MDSMHSDQLLPMMLDAAVPLWVLKMREDSALLKKTLAESGEFSQDLAEHGDALLYRIPGKTADMFNKLARSIAALSFRPGGVKVFGRHWETKRSSPGSTKKRRSSKKRR